MRLIYHFTVKTQEIRREIIEIENVFEYRNTF